MNVGGGWGQSLLAKDLAAKTRAVELALARGANILDAVMSRKHDRETELDSRCRDMYIAQHEVPARARPSTHGPRPRQHQQRPRQPTGVLQPTHTHTHTHLPVPPTQKAQPPAPHSPQRSSSEVLPPPLTCLHPSQQVPSS